MKSGGNPLALVPLSIGANLMSPSLLATETYRIIQFLIILAACFVESAWNNLSWYLKQTLELAAKGWADKLGIDDAVDGMKKAATSNEEKEDIDSVVSKAKEIVKDLYKDDVDFKYAPIGCYVIGKNNIFFQFLYGPFIYYVIKILTVSFGPHPPSL